MNSFIYCEKLSKTYHSGQADAFNALLNVELTIDEGEIVVFKGPSGSGKTTLLSLIGCMNRPSSGRVVVEGREVSRLSERFLTQVRRQLFGFVFQQYNLLKDLSVLENVVLPLYPEAIGFGQMRQRAEEVLERLSLSGKVDTKIQRLSGGEQQRVAIARAMINRPKILIADEPTAHLDSSLAEYFLTIMADLNRQGTTILMASHDPQVYEHPLAQRVVSMSDGAVIADDSR